jgi:hypothetical protein
VATIAAKKKTIKMWQQSAVKNYSKMQRISARKHNVVPAPLDRSEAYKLHQKPIFDLVFKEIVMALHQVE